VRPPATFLSALRLEALALRLGAPGARVVTFGMGERAATAACARLSRSSAGPTVLFGCSGGLESSLRPGDIVVATEVALVGTDETVALDGAEAYAGELAAHGLRVVAAPIVTSRRLVVGDEARAKASAGGAVAVDMESWFLAPLARDRPFAVVRVVLDVPGREVISPSTAVGAVRAGRALGRAARVMQQSKVLFEIPTSNEHPGEN
jgi:4-hydroxy-3-methylbut-2-en-1-yl diphosphate reductase